MENYNQHLSNSIKVLALEPEYQLDFLDFIGCPGNVDELALQFSDYASGADHNVEEEEITQSQADFVKKIDQRLEKISGQENVHLWTEQAVRESVEWREIRKLAREYLQTWPS